MSEMKKGILYLAFSEAERNDFEKLEYERAMSAQLFAESNAILIVDEFADCSDLFWEARGGLKQILLNIKSNPNKFDCLLVYGYGNLIYQQRDFDNLKRTLLDLEIELISIYRGEIEIESEYYFEP